MKDLRKTLPGLLLAVAIGSFAFAFSELHKTLDSLVVGIVLGMLCRAAIGKRERLEPGFRGAADLFITVGIIFYGVNLKFHKLNVIPLTTWLQIIIGIVLIFWAAVWFGERLGLRRQLSLLVAVGTAICGASAIALTTPVIKGKPEETGSALLTITVWGLVGVMLFPLLQQLLEISGENYALLAATALHQTGLVKLASGIVSEECLQTAMIIKMARTCMIIPLMCLFAWWPGLIGEETQKRMPIPWFLWGFLGVGLVFSLVPALRPYADQVKPVSTLLWTMAMTGLGLCVDVRSLLSTLGRPLFLGLAAWLIVTGNFFLGYFGMGY